MNYWTFFTITRTLYIVCCYFKKHKKKKYGNKILSAFKQKEPEENFFFVCLFVYLRTFYMI